MILIQNATNFYEHVIRFEYLSSTLHETKSQKCSKDRTFWSIITKLDRNLTSRIIFKRHFCSRYLSSIIDFHVKKKPNHLCLQYFYKDRNISLQANSKFRPNAFNWTGTLVKKVIKCHLEAPDIYAKQLK